MVTSHISRLSNCGMIVLLKFVLLCHCRWNLLKQRKTRYSTDGINSVKYECVGIFYMRLYTHILADLKEPESAVATKTSWNCKPVANTATLERKSSTAYTCCSDNVQWKRKTKTIGPYKRHRGTMVPTLQPCSEDQAIFHRSGFRPLWGIVPERFANPVW